MSQIRISQLRNSSILRVYAERNTIQSDPDYQRMGEVWTIEKRQLLIDTIINDFDIPKLYFHEFSQPKKLANGRTVRYAVIDGRQRLEAIWGFIEGKFTLATDFILFEDPTVKAAGLTYGDLGKDYPHLKTLIDSYNLPVTTVSTEDLDLIEEMFLRLNEAVPLNAAEKRNAMGGPMAEMIRDAANHEFFRINIPFSNGRYQHREVAAKFLLLTASNSIGDTKKSYLDSMVRQYGTQDMRGEAQQIKDKVTTVLAWSRELFVSGDPLLRTQAMTVIYYQVVKQAMEEGWDSEITRSKLTSFEERRQENRVLAEEDIAKAEYDLLEFDRMHLQGSNDRTSIEFRSRTLAKYIQEYEK